MTVEVNSPDLVAAARLMLQQMGVDPADLVGEPRRRKPVPTIDEYIPVVAATLGESTRQTYMTYWNRTSAQWGTRTLLEVTPSEIAEFCEDIKSNSVLRRNGRGGASAAESFISALRCLYKHAEKDGLITEAENPARKAAKPHRQPSTRGALTNSQLAEINHFAATTGDDPELDTLLIRLHTETACRRAGALGLRPRDLDPTHSQIYLREKNGTARWQAVRLIQGELIACKPILDGVPEVSGGPLGERIGLPHSIDSATDRLTCIIPPGSHARASPISASRFTPIREMPNGRGRRFSACSGRLSSLWHIFAGIGFRSNSRKRMRCPSRRSVGRSPD